MSVEVITIDMAEMAVGSHDTKIQTISLGSCVAIILHDHKANIGGMAHALLPSRALISPVDPAGGAQTPKAGSSVAKFVDEAVDRLYKEIEKLGAKKENVRAKLVGGATMFRLLAGNEQGIGYRNAESARTCLRTLGIAIESEDLGGTVGRAAELDMASGLVLVTTVI